jgi:hypothetical protein
MVTHSLSLLAHCLHKDPNLYDNFVTSGYLLLNDNALQAVQTLQELTLNLVIVSPGHTPNWDMVADMVNCVSRTHRSPKQCRSR